MSDSYDAYYSSNKVNIVAILSYIVTLVIVKGMSKTSFESSFDLFCYISLGFFVTSSFAVNCKIRFLSSENLKNYIDAILKYYKTNNGLVPLAEFNESHIQNTVKGLEVIKDQGGDLMDFVQSYRSFLSLPKPDKALINADGLLKKVKVLMSQENDSQPTNFEIVVQPTDLELYLDEKQISQILINLCKNALQSLNGQEDGKIKMNAGITKDGKKYIRVVDNGPGIPPELMDEIFVPFFTTKDTGTGIGLSLSKQIMHLHGGSMSVHSVPQKETAFLLVF